MPAPLMAVHQCCSASPMQSVGCKLMRIELDHLNNVLRRFAGLVGGIYAPSVFMGSPLVLHIEGPVNKGPCTHVFLDSQCVVAVRDSSHTVRLSGATLGSAFGCIVADIAQPLGATVAEPQVPQQPSPCRATLLSESRMPSHLEHGSAERRDSIVLWRRCMPWLEWRQCWQPTAGCR